MGSCVTRFRTVPRIVRSSSPERSAGPLCARTTPHGMSATSNVAQATVDERDFARIGKLIKADSLGKRTFRLILSSPIITQYNDSRLAGFISPLRNSSAGRRETKAVHSDMHLVCERDKRKNGIAIGPHPSGRAHIPTR